MTPRSIAITLTLFIASAASATAQSNVFTLVSAGHPAGEVRYTIEPVKGGFHMKSNVIYVNPSIVEATKNQLFAETQFSTDFLADENGNTLTGSTMTDINTKYVSTFLLDKTRTSVDTNFIHMGKVERAKNVPVPNPNFMIVPDYDPSGIQLLLNVVATHAHPDGRYVLILPQHSKVVRDTENPDNGGIHAPASPKVVTVSVQPSGNASGTLDGTPIGLKKYILTYPTFKAALFTDDANQLMQIYLAKPSVGYVRKNFVLLTQQPSQLDTTPAIP